MTNPDNVTKEELVKVLDHLLDISAVSKRNTRYPRDTPGLVLNDIYQSGRDSEGLDTEDLPMDLNDICNRLWG